MPRCGREGDELIDVQITEEDQEIILASRSGMAIRFNEADARHLIAGAVVEMTVNVMHGHEYDPARYVKLLNRLPKLPWE